MIYERTQLGTTSEEKSQIGMACFSEKVRWDDLLMSKLETCRYSTTMVCFGELVARWFAKMKMAT